MNKLKKYLLVLACLVAMAGVIVAQPYTRDNAPIRQEVTVAEGEALNLVISCYDPDGDVVTLTVEDLPTGAAASPAQLQPPGYTDPNLPAPPADSTPAWYTTTVTWTPNFAQSGDYTLYVHAVDDKGAETWIRYVVHVTNVNRPPVL